jgi:amino acid transporter
MINYHYWLINTKLNTTGYGIYATFLTFFGLVLADNRFELDTALYITMGILWMIVLINLFLIKKIKSYKEKQESIPLILKIFISIQIIGIVLVFIMGMGYQGTDIPHLNLDTKNDPNDKILEEVTNDVHT